MEVIGLSLLVTTLLLLVGTVLLWTTLGARSVTFRVSAQVILFLLFPPIYLLIANVIFYLETEDGKAMVVSEMPVTWDVPRQCKNIQFHRDPGGEWFLCEIQETDAKLWLSSRQFEPSDNYQCPSMIDSKILQSVSQSQFKATYFQTPVEENGAGLDAMLNGNYLVACQWYW